MVVKAVRGRRRYIALHVPEGLSRDDLVRGIESHPSFTPDVKVITCRGGDAVVRCEPAHVDAVTGAVSELWPGSESRRTSGTLRTLRDRYPELRVPRKRKRSC
jgi:RNase P/RNase MRP subunit POP5